MTGGVVDLLELGYQQLFLVFSPLTDEIISYYVMTAISALSTQKCLLRRFFAWYCDVLCRRLDWGQRRTPKGVLQTAKIVCRRYPEEEGWLVCQQNQSSLEKICRWNITTKRKRERERKKKKLNFESVLAILAWIIFRLLFK